MAAASVRACPPSSAPPAAARRRAAADSPGRLLGCARPTGGTEGVIESKEGQVRREASGRG
eukprot:318458-Chlamydomonas_euryale.AAC.1